MTKFWDHERRDAGSFTMRQAEGAGGTMCMQAREQMTLEDIMAEIPGRRRLAVKRFERLRRVVKIPDNAMVLDIGSAQGGFVASCQILGHRGFGIEPWADARAKSNLLSERLSVPINVAGGVAEAIPFRDGTFDLVHAESVLEHVVDIDAAVAEIFRVLKPGGVFWFHSTSALCPFQNEIAGFPLFGWYPYPLKVRIMNWARINRPGLVGHTEYPAMHWFTPGSARRLLRKHGFTKIHDRWDVSGVNDGRGLRNRALRIIASCRLTKTAADIIRHGSSYTAVK